MVHFWYAAFCITSSFFFGGAQECQALLRDRSALLCLIAWIDDFARNKWIIHGSQWLSRVINGYQ